jgi:hypothetical protein
VSSLLEQDINETAIVRLSPARTAFEIFIKTNSLSDRRSGVQYTSPKN